MKNGFRAWVSADDQVLEKIGDPVGLDSNMLEVNREVQIILQLGIFTSNLLFNHMFSFFTLTQMTPS